MKRERYLSARTLRQHLAVTMSRAVSKMKVEMNETNSIRVANALLRLSCRLYVAQHGIDLASFLQVVATQFLLETGDAEAVAHSKSPKGAKA